MKDQEVVATNVTYPWSFATQLFHSSQPSHGGDGKSFKVIGALDSVASLSAATLYQGNPDRNHHFWNIVSTKRYIPHYAGASHSIVEPFNQGQPWYKYCIYRI